MKAGRFALAALIVFAAFGLCSCTTALVGYLIYDYLNDSAPKYTWSGTVTDSMADPVEGVRVQIRAEVLGEDEVMVFSELTDEDGDYSVTYRWSSEVSYSIWVYSGDDAVYNVSLGEIDKGAQKMDITLEGVYNAEVSGVVSDADGDPLQDVVVIMAMGDTLDEATAFMLDEDDETAYDLTNEGGIYSFEGRMEKYAIICAYHPDYGFAYAYAEDTDGDGSYGLNVAMGAAGEYDVDVQVVDGLGDPIESQVLSSDQQFRVQLSLQWDFSEEMDSVVEDNSLFAGRNIIPSDLHPETVTFSVQATGADGLASGATDVTGGTYDITLLNLSDDDLATALVNSDNPLALGEDSVIIVRVN